MSARVENRVRTALIAPALAVGLLSALTAAAPAASAAGNTSSIPLTFVPAVAKQAKHKIKPMKVERRVTISKQTWTLPVSGYRLTGRFGASSGLWSSTHTGLDFAAPYGAEIRAVANGVITETAYEGSYGNRTILKLDDGTEMWFCHQNDFVVSVGQRVSAGQVIGHIGMTGNTTGPHLHLEVHPGAGDPVDPEAALAAKGLRA